MYYEVLSILNIYLNMGMLQNFQGAVVAEWLSSWLAEQEVRVQFLAT